LKKYFWNKGTDNCREEVCPIGRKVGFSKDFTTDLAPIGRKMGFSKDFTTDLAPIGRKVL
jgi:hypothetical protein